MASTNLQAVTAPPSLIRSLKAGFDAISNHVGLILIPIGMDLLLWFGPRLRLASVFAPMFDQPISLPEMQDPQFIEMLQTAIREFNLLSVIRTFPVGIPSLMAKSPGIEIPYGSLLVWEIPSPIIMLGLWFVLSLVGLATGVLYFLIVAQASLEEKINWRQAFSHWPWVYSQVFLLVLAWLALLTLIFIPFSCLFTLLMLGGMEMGQVSLVGILFFAGLLVWLLVPLFFSPFGIFVHKLNMWSSLVKSVRLTRMTLPTTSLLLVAMLVISEGMDILWNIPPDNSWLTLVGIAGHAFITTGLLAACFVYYRDADRWVQRLLQQAKLSTS